MGSGCSSLVNKPTAVDPIKHAVFSPGSPNVGEVGPGSSKPGDPGLPAGILFIRYREPKHMEEVAQAAARTLEGAEMAFGATALVIRDDYSAKALKSQEASSQEGELGDPGSVATPRETSGSKGRSSVAHPNLRGLEVLDELVAKRSVKDICIAESEPCIQLVPSEDQELLIPSPMKQNKCRSLPGKGGGGIYPAESNGVKFLYKIGKTLGTGAFSTVKLATNRETGEKHAVKIMKVGDLDGQTSLEGARLEVQLLQDAAHANVIQLIECFEEGHKVYIVSELLAGGELLQSLADKGSYTEQDAQACFKSVLRALQHMHSKGIVHRDLKLENLLLKDKDDISSVKIIDFGLAKYVSTPETTQTVVGTPLYIAPEIISNTGVIDNTRYDTPNDMWSAGVILYILLAGFPPFYDESEPKLLSMIKECSYSFDDPAWQGISCSAKDLVSKLLVFDAKQRITAAHALQHPWCSGTLDRLNTLSTTVLNLRQMLAVKLKGVVKSIMALKRMNMGALDTKFRRRSSAGSDEYDALGPLAYDRKLPTRLFRQSDSDALDSKASGPGPRHRASVL